MTYQRTEKLTGSNRYTVRRLIGNMHVSTPIRAAIRQVIQYQVDAKAGFVWLRDVPKPLRRGLYLCVIETMRENMAVYRSVMG